MCPGFIDSIISRFLFILSIKVYKEIYKKLTEERMSGVGLARTLVPVGMFGLGTATGFVLRDELNMPTYMRIKMALVEHSILTRKKLDFDTL